MTNVRVQPYATTNWQASPERPPPRGPSTPVEQGNALRAQDEGAGPSKRKDLHLPPTPALAPVQVRFSDTVQKVFDEQWANSFPGGSSKEQGGTVVFNRESGALSVVNIGGLGSTAGTFSPDLVVADATSTGVLGVFHTHPYDATEGGATRVSLSGGDAAYMINDKQSLIIAQSGDMQFMYMRTAETPQKVDFAKVNTEQNNRVAVLMGEGQTFSTASRTAANETAVTYKLAYFEGANGVLNRVSPPR